MIDKGDGEERSIVGGAHGLRCQEGGTEVQVSHHCFVILSHLHSSTTFLLCITSLFARNAILLRIALLIFCPSFLDNPARPVGHTAAHQETFRDHGNNVHSDAQIGKGHLGLVIRKEKGSLASLTSNKWFHVTDHLDTY